MMPVHLTKTQWLTISRHRKKQFVIEDLVAWNPNVRSKSAIRTSLFAEAAEVENISLPDDFWEEI